MSGHTEPIANECPLCAMWARIPYAARHTTPVPVPEVEGILIVGFWLRARHPEGLVVRLCERHGQSLINLDAQEETRKIHLANMAERERRARAQAAEEAAAAARGAPFASQVQRIVSAALPPNQPSHADLIAAGQALPVVQPPPPMPGIMALPPMAVSGPPQAPLPNTPESQLDQMVKHNNAVAGGQPPPEQATQGAKVAYQCSICGQRAVTGELHACA